MAKKILMNAKKRKMVSNAVYEILKSTYFADGVPLHEISSTLKKFGVIMVMEDNTEWSGLVCGDEGSCNIRLAPIESMWTPDNPEGYTGHGFKFYESYDNAGLILSWYRCTSRRDGKYEVIGYIS